MSEQVRIDTITAEQRQAIWLNNLLAGRRNMMTRLSQTEARQGDRRMVNLRVLLVATTLSAGGLMMTAVMI
jgi:hypothetical protein